MDVEQLTCNDLLTNNVIDLDVNYLQIQDNDYDSLIDKRAGIWKLSKDLSIKNICNEFINKRDEIQSPVKFILAHYEKVTHNKWVKPNYKQERIARIMTNILLQEMMSNAFRKILKGSEDFLIEVVSRLIDVIMWGLPIKYDIKVTRGKCQSVASKDRKLQQSSGSKRNRSDLMIQAYLRNKWDEVAYIESSKWQAKWSKNFWWL